jgi:hypothetical protein
MPVYLKIHEQEALLEAMVRDHSVMANGTTRSLLTHRAPLRRRWARAPSRGSGSGRSR